MIFILTTCKNDAEAKRIAMTLLRLRLVACAKRWPIRSLYRWEGKLRNDQEVALLCEASKKQFTKIEQLIRRMHSYDTPCIVSWETSRGSKKYLQWVSAALRLRHF